MTSLLRNATILAPRVLDPIATALLLFQFFKLSSQKRSPVINALAIQEVEG